MSRRAILLGGLVVGMTLSLASTASRADEIPAGQRVFVRECAKCHEIGPGARNRVGPQLNGLFGRKAGSVANYKYYSAANRDADFVWTPEFFAKFVLDPKGMLRGTTQVYSGLKDPKDVQPLIDYLSKY